MKVLYNNIWNLYNAEDNIIVITTNGYVKKSGECVMGKGIALEAKRKFSKFASMLGEKILAEGNKVFYFSELRIITLPVKHNWWEMADLGLIKRSVKELIELYKKEIESSGRCIYMPKPGCGNGRLRWSVVKAHIEPIIGDCRIIIVDLK